MKQVPQSSHSRFRFTIKASPRSVLCPITHPLPPCLARTHTRDQYHCD